MSHPYDASTKYLVQTRLADWLPLCGRTTAAELQIIDADLATVNVPLGKPEKVVKAIGSAGLEVIPQPQPELLLELSEELPLLALAVKVVDAKPSEFSADAAPLPAGLSRQAAAVIHFLAE